MDDAKKEALDRALTMLVDSLEQGKEFVIEQAPLVVQELIVLGRAKHTGLFVIGIIGLIALYVIGKRIVRWVSERLKKDPGDDEAFAAMLAGTILGAIVIVVLSIVALVNFSPMLEAWFAPRVYVLHQLKGLL